MTNPVETIPLRALHHIIKTPKRRTVAIAVKGHDVLGFNVVNPLKFKARLLAALKAEEFTRDCYRHPVFFYIRANLTYTYTAAVLHAETNALGNFIVIALPASRLIAVRIQKQGHSILMA